MLPNRTEYPCQMINMSPGGFAALAPVAPDIGARIVAYFDELGRLEGEVVRHFTNGFAVRLAVTQRKRDKLAEQLTWITNRQALGIPDDRRHERYIPRNPTSTLTLVSGMTIACRVDDVSVSGAAVSAAVRPDIGVRVTLGTISGRVVRHLGERAFAIEFSRIQHPAALADQFGIDL